MSIVTSQQLTRYFEQYGEEEVTFNRQVISATGMITRNVYLKVLDQQWPCIVYSCSMIGARVIAGVKTTFFDALRHAANHVALHCSFKLPDKVEPISFFVPSHAASFMQYNPQNPDVQIVSLEFTQRPSDDLILILGTLLEANCNSLQRKEERIVITEQNIKKLGLESRYALLAIEGAGHRCIIRDLSFSGTKLLLAGNAAALVNGKVSMRIAKGEQAADMVLAGKIVRVEDVEGRQDIHALGIAYEGEPPMSYKLMINSFLTTMRKYSKPPPARGNRNA